MSTDGASTLLREILAAEFDEDVLRALSVREQRYALYHFLDHERATLDELADALAGWMAATENRVTTNVDRSSLRLALYHRSLPQLDDAGLLSFDPERKVVNRSPLSTAERDLIEAACIAEHWTDDTPVQ